jgi:cell shape-determining protein MreC
MHPRISLGLVVVLAGTGLVLAQVLPPSTPRIPVTAVQVDLATPVATLQQQVASLQASVAALQSKTQLISSNGVSLSLMSGSSALTVSPAGVALIGPLVTLNGNGRPAARVGDQVVTSGGAGRIIQGSATVLIGN